MAISFILIIAAIIGIVYGLKNDNDALLAVSGTVLVLILAVMVYFYSNPY